MAKRLEGTAALVTGASSGIGEAKARALAAEGAIVAVVARRRERLETLVAKIHEAGGRAIAIPADVADGGEAKAAVERAASELGRLDTVINNAGLMLIGPFKDAPPDEWERMLSVNVQGVFNVARAAIPHLVQAAANGPRRVADIVNISSTAGRSTRPNTVVYSATKFAVQAFTEGLRQELLADRVRVSVVEPGTVDTELAGHSRDGIREAVKKQIASFELMRPEDIADAVSFIVTRDRRVAVNEMLVRAGAQAW
jgi:NADP-dependent 3-hydroxy acid dehydrogenase YdfG